MADLATFAPLNSPASDSANARVTPQWGEAAWERNSYGETEESLETEQSKAVTEAENIVREAQDATPIPEPFLKAFESAESTDSDKEPLGTLSFNGVELSAVSKDAFGSVTGSVVEAATDIAKDMPGAIAELFGQIMGKDSKSKESGKPDQKKQANAEQARIFNSAMESDKNKNAMQKMKDLMAAALRMSDHTMTLTEVTQEFNPNLTVPEQTPDLGINQIAFTYDRIVERRAQAKQAQSQNGLGGGAAGSPNYFMQQNMAGERSGGMHVMNAAG